MGGPAGHGARSVRARENGEGNRNREVLLAGAKFSAVSVLTCEVLYTFFLVFVVLRSAVSSRNPASKEYFPIAIAFTVLAGAYGAGAVSGGCFNPAVAIGIDVTSAWAGVEWCIPYALAEFLGAALAVGVNSALEGEESKGKYFP